MDLRGFNKFSLVDYPGKIGCIIFCGGCNLRCPFCHNPCLVLDPKSQPRVTEKEFFNFLKNREGLVEGIVISGGEPTLQSDLSEFMKKIKEYNFKIKLDTNGTYPQRLEELLKESLIDSVGIDYKAPKNRYSSLCGIEECNVGENVQESIKLAIKYGVESDIRTTVHKKLLSLDDLEQMYEELKSIGMNNWVLQQFNPVETIYDELQNEKTYSDSELVSFSKKLGEHVKVRGLSGRFI